MNRLAIFAKPPVVGGVKTRLSPALPPALACDLYRAMLRDALDAGWRSGAEERLVYWSEPVTEVALGEAAASLAPYEARMQQGHDLGARLERAFEEMLRASDDRAVVLGADCPALEPPMIDAALTALDSCDMVVGPTRDGGYYLVGLRRSVPDLFAGIAWSTGRELGQTLERARDAKLTTVTLGQLEDLDTSEDLVRLLASAAQGRLHARWTMVALRTMALVPPETAWW